MRIITVAWLALLTEEAFNAALAANPALVAATLDVPWDGETGGPVGVISPQGEALPLAFDHDDIIALAILRLRGKLAYSEVGFALLPECFTLRQLQSVHEAILGIPLNKPAFRRRMLDKGWLVATGQREDRASYRPAELFRYHRSL
jgi:8-oxo-dGTP diphosphatase